MLIRLGANYAAHMIGGLAVGALAMTALHLARKLERQRRVEHQPPDDSPAPAS